jgi:hypothetical protein
MSKHRLHDFKHKEHVAMKQLGSIIFAARVRTTGTWVLAQGMWAKDRRRGIQTQQAIQQT